MQRITGTNAVDIGGGKLGFRDRNLAAGLSGTGVKADWLTALQEEVAGLVEGAGIALASGTWTQVRDALRRLYGGNSRITTDSITLTADDAGLLQVNCSAGSRTLILPACNAANARPLIFEIVRMDASANALTIQRQGSSDLIEAATSLSIPPQGRVRLVGDGIGTWRIVAGWETLQTPQLASAGYMLVPNGLRRPYLRQWARLTVLGPSAGLIWTFPLAFSEGCYGAQAMPISVGGGSALTSEAVSIVGTPTATQAQFDNLPGTNSVDVFVEAWGV